MILQMLPLLCLMFPVFSDIPFFLNTNLQKTDLKFSLAQSSKNPCENFYEYSCSTWKAETTKPDYEVSWSHFTAASYEIKKKVQTILNTPLNTTNPLLNKAQRFYNACVSFNNYENEYFSNLKLTIEYFKGWPLVHENWFVDKYNWLEEIVDITRKLGFYPILKFHVGIDYKDTNKYILYIEPGNLIFPQSILLNPSQFAMEVTAYTQWISKTIRHLYPDTKNLNTLKWDVLKIVEFELQLAKLMSVKPKVERNTVENFSSRYQTNFLRIFDILFSNLEFKIYPDDMVIIRNYDYFKNLALFLAKTDSKRIANYLIWSIVKEFSRDTTTYLKNLNFFIDMSVVGLTSDISRDVECTNKAIDHFGLAILPKYLDFYLNNNSLKEVYKIVTNVKLEYVNLLRANKWLSNGTKLLAIKKIENIGCVVGYSDWMRNKTLLELYYLKLNITDDHLINMIRAKNLRIENNLKLLGTSVDSELWPSNIFDVNAYYSVLQNIVFIPLGILQFPFFDENRPSIFNYGGLGTLIGHELSHSLDTTGRQANLNGIIKKWWPVQDIAEYQMKTKCFEELFKDKNTQNILLMGENIADNVGLDISFKAYKKLKNVEMEDIFWKLKSDYIFFLTYAQMWCELSDQREVFSDEHTSVEIRVNQAVQNNLYFNNIFDCFKNTSETIICKLW